MRSSLRRLPQLAELSLDKSELKSMIGFGVGNHYGKSF
jgi:hypothetical protein